MYKGEEAGSFCSRAKRPPSLLKSYREVEIDPKNPFKGPSARNGQRRSAVRCANRLQGYWKPGRTNLGAICQWAVNDCPCMECGGPC